MIFQHFPRLSVSLSHNTINRSRNIVATEERADRLIVVVVVVVSRHLRAVARATHKLLSSISDKLRSSDKLCQSCDSCKRLTDDDGVAKRSEWFISFAAANVSDCGSKSHTFVLKCIIHKSTHTQTHILYKTYTRYTRGEAGPKLIIIIIAVVIISLLFATEHCKLAVCRHSGNSLCLSVCLINIGFVCCCLSLLNKKIYLISDRLSNCLLVRLVRCLSVARRNSGTLSLVSRRGFYAAAWLWRSRRIFAAIVLQLFGAGCLHIALVVCVRVCVSLLSVRDVGVDFESFGARFDGADYDSRLESDSGIVCLTPHWIYTE